MFFHCSLFRVHVYTRLRRHGTGIVSDKQNWGFDWEQSEPTSSGMQFTARYVWPDWATRFIVLSGIHKWHTWHTMCPKPLSQLWIISSSFCIVESQISYLLARWVGLHYHEAARVPDINWSLASTPNLIWAFASSVQRGDGREKARLFGIHLEACLKMNVSWRYPGSP